MGQRKVLFVTLIAVLGLILPLVPAGAQSGTAGIHGTVSASGDPGVEDICVAAIDANGDVAGNDVTDANGEYDINGLAPGDYRLYFYDCSDARTEAQKYAFEWYFNADQFETANVISLAAGEDAARDAVLNQGGEISGKVTAQDGGAALGDICVFAINPLDYRFVNAIDTNTDGTYTIGGLRTQQDYWLKFSDCSAPDAGTYAFEWWNDQLTIDEADLIPVPDTSGETGYDVALARAGSISGTVTGPNTACIDVVYEGYHSVAGATVSGGGTMAYTVGGLPPGDYKVSFYDCDEQSPNLGYEWWQEAGSIHDATVVTVEAGQGEGGVNGTLTAGGSITGNVSPDGSDGDIANICAVAHDSAVHDRPVLGARTDANGDFTIDNLRAGNSYKVEYFDCRRNDRRYRLEYHDGDQALLFQSGDAVAVTAGQSTTANASLGDIVDRAAGKQRIQTAVDLSQKAFESADTVVLARHDEYPDALAGAPLAHAVDAPILLTPTGWLHEDTRAEIERLGADRAILLGLHNALSQQVEDEVGALVSDVDRVGGQDRYGTARDIAAQPELDGATHVYVTEGDHAEDTRGWPDAISGSGLAAHMGRPILLTLQHTLPSETRAALQALPDGSDATIIGGPVAVSQEVEDDIASEIDTVDRLAGDDRYETSRIVAEFSEDARNAEDGTEMSVNRMWLARGDNWPDALAGGPTVARDLGVLLIVPQTGLESHTRGFLEWYSDEIHRVMLLGGPEALFPQVVQDVRDAIDAGSAFSSQSAGGSTATTTPLLFPGTDAWRTLIAGESG